MHKPSKSNKSGIGSKDYLRKNGDGDDMAFGNNADADSPVFELHLINWCLYSEEISNAQTK